MGKILGAIGLVVVIGASLWWITRSVAPDGPPKAVLGWKCSKCDEEFEASRDDDPKASFSESDAFPKAACPKCQGVAHRLVPYRCSKCSHDFGLLLAPDPKTGKPPRYACPECGDARVAPVKALEKR